jgi:hypothetical protein
VQFTALVVGIDGIVDFSKELPKSQDIGFLPAHIVVTVEWVDNVDLVFDFSLSRKFSDVVVTQSIVVCKML